MNISDQNKYVTSSTQHQEQSLNGEEMEKLNTLQQREDNIVIPFKILLPPRKTPIKKTTVIVEYHQEDNTTTSKDKLNSSNQDTLTTQLSEILDQGLTLKEKDLKPFWTKQSEEISRKLWLPTKTDYQDSVLTCSKVSSLNTPMGKSWFSIEKKLPHKKNFSLTSSPSLPFSPHDYMVSEVIPSKKKSKQQKTLKTLKGRLLPTKEEEEKLQLMMEQSRWYYNFLVSVIQKKYGDLKKLKSLSYYTIRDILTQYDYIEENDTTRYFQSRIDNNNKNQIFPPWWDKPHNRLPRGVAKKLSQNINSMLSNYHNKNIKDFELKFKSKKSTLIDFVLFEDSSFPAFLKDIQSQYWFTTKDRRKEKVSLKEIIQQQSKVSGIEILYDKVKNHYYFCYPVDYNFYPQKDRRNESQIHFVSSEDGERIISLDPGIRKFLVGYDPNENIVMIGNKASKEIIPLLQSIDKCKDKIKNQQQWRKIRNKINEMHWKTISFLTRNYDVIVIPNFRISEMVRTKKLPKITKRMLYMFCFHSFFLKLKFKCETTKTTLKIVGEEYTSKTCTGCGELNNVGSSEVYHCDSCHLTIDRDINASRNILLKNIKPCSR